MSEGSRTGALRGVGGWTVRSAWTTFCRTVVRVFYRRCEVHGLEHVPARGPVLFCANHPSAVIDAVVLQAALPRTLHPLARSGLFRNPLLWPILRLIQAVPVYRRQDMGTDPARNQDMFRRCHTLLARGGALLIFPEGESHMDPAMRTMKTGAARVALDAVAAEAPTLTLLPVGLTFTEVGRFRNSVLVQVGAPLPVGKGADESREQAVIRLTGEIEGALRQLTLNLASWQEHALLRRLERFFALRHGKYRRRNLNQRFRALQKLGDALTRLRDRDPEALERTARRLQQFERLCARFGVKDYQLTTSNTPGTVARFVGRSLVILLLLLPVGLWGLVNSIAPFLLTGALAERLASDRYQYDTAKVGLGMAFFALFWGSQTALVQTWWGWPMALGYLASLPPATGIALFVQQERRRITENIRTFFRFLRDRRLREVLAAKRQELERDLARLARLAKRRLDEPSD